MNPGHPGFIPGRNLAVIAVHMHYVYLLKLSNGDVYKGRTKNIERRISDHQSGKVSFTKNKLPALLLGYEVYTEDSDAIRRERYLKSSDGLRDLKRQYRDALYKEC